MTPAEDRQDEAATLSRELGELLIELSIGVHRYAMYPPGHPSLRPVANRVAARLARCLRDRERLNVGVARDQLVIEGIATDPGHPVLSDLARRLHGHQLGALTVRHGVGKHEVEGLLATLASEVDEDDETPVGRLPREQIPAWEHVSFHPLGYSELELDETSAASGTTPDRAAALWLGLARAAMAVDEPYAPDGVPDSKVVADRIRSHRREEAYDQVIAGYLLQLADELGGDAAEVRKVRSRVSNLVRELDEDTLGRLLEMGGDAEQRQDFLRHANRGFAADAVVKILRAASDPGARPVSNSLARLLTKLSRYAEEGEGGLRGRADTAVRNNVERLLQGWELEDPNPHEYNRLLDRVARAVVPTAGRTGEGEGEEASEREADGSYRIVETALEVDAFGPVVGRAVRRILDEADPGRLLERVDEAGASAAAERIREIVLSPDQLRRVLSREGVDFATVDLLLERMGPSSVPPLLDALVDAESRAVRRQALDRLREMGEVPAEEIVDRLDGAPWYAVRNLLVLMRDLDVRPPGFDPAAYLDHEDPRVRREAFRLAVAEPGARDRALAAGLADVDDRLVRRALLEIRDEVSEALVPTVVRRVLRAERADGVRALAVRCLADSPSPLVRKALLELAAGGRTLLRRPKVAEKSAAVLAALEVLAQRWPEHPEVRPLLERARSADDPEIRDAAAEDEGAAG